MAKNNNQKTKIITIGIVALALCASGVLLYVNHHQAKRQPDTAVHAGPKTDTPPAHSTNPDGTGKMVSNPDHPITSTLAKPEGPLIGRRSVSLSGDTNLTASCSSVPGASCYLQASKDESVIRLTDAKTITDETGDFSVGFEWNAKKLSQGTWMMQVVASKDNQTSYSVAEPLEVQP